MFEGGDYWRGKLLMQLTSGQELNKIGSCFDGWVRSPSGSQLTKHLIVKSPIESWQKRIQVSHGESNNWHEIRDIQVNHRGLDTWHVDGSPKWSWRNECLKMMKSQGV